ncbi:MAG: hypothetical protein JOS17DRAFT_845563 [Linnemannia elongata]|nr:MAG: hypothetical protein JOS17DRAFT_845563 [Linnemannia elongata]
MCLLIQLLCYFILTPVSHLQILNQRRPLNMPPIRHKEQPTLSTSSPTYHKKRRANSTDEERHKIIHAIGNEGDIYSTASKRFMVPYNTVRSIFFTLQNTNRGFKLPRGGNRRPRLEKEQLEWLKARLFEPDVPIADLHDQLSKCSGLKPPVSKSTVQIAVQKRIGYTQNLIHPEPISYNDPDHIQARKVGAEQTYERSDSLHDFVCVDESVFNLHIRRKFGRSPPMSVFSNELKSKEILICRWLWLSRLTRVTSSRASSRTSYSSSSTVAGSSSRKIVASTKRGPS